MVTCQDVENLEIKQEDQEVVLKSEAFQIYVELSEILDNNKLNFGFVRVFEIEEQTFLVKNTGLYAIDFNF